jgi:uncharacterized protein
MATFQKARDLQFEATKTSGNVSALLVLPGNAQRLLVLAHGAGAGMRHKFMEATANSLAEVGIGTFRYQFPYMEKKLRRIDPKPVLFATVRSAILAATKVASGLQLLAGGKSMGGRMTSMAAAQEELPGVRGLVFVGFPLHPAGQPSIERADHLRNVTVPMLFLQGTRDTLADLKLLKPICRHLGKRAVLHIVDGADHSFHVLKSSGITDDDVLADLAYATKKWSDSLDRQG